MHLDRNTKAETIAAQMVKGVNPSLQEWIETLSDSDIDTLATAAKASKAQGMSAIDSSLIDPETIERLNADYAAFMERNGEGA